jgi:hypothetical protein
MTMKKKENQKLKKRENLNKSKNGMKRKMIKYGMMMQIFHMGRL